MARLFVWSEANGLRAFTLERDSTLVGRGADCDVPLTNEVKLSRHHLKVLRDPAGAFAIEDLGSSNGTYFGARRISGRQALNDADVFSVGPVHLQVRLQFAAPCTIPGAGVGDETQVGASDPTLLNSPPPTPPSSPTRTPAPAAKAARPVSGVRAASAAPSPSRAGKRLLADANRRRRRNLLAVFGVLLALAGGVWAVAIFRDHTGADDVPPAPPPGHSDDAPIAGNTATVDNRAAAPIGARITPLSTVRVQLPGVDAEVALQIDMRFGEADAIAVARSEYLSAAERETSSDALPWNDRRAFAAGVLFDRAGRGKVQAHVRAQEMVDQMAAIGNESMRDAMEAAALDLLIETNSDWNSSKGRLPRILNALRAGAGRIDDQPLPPPAPPPTTPIGTFIYQPEATTHAELTVDVLRPLTTDDFARAFRAAIANLPADALADQIEQRRRDSELALRRVHRLLVRLHRCVQELVSDSEVEKVERRMRTDRRLQELIDRAVADIDVPGDEAFRMLIANDLPLRPPPTYPMEVVSAAQLPTLVARVRQLPPDKRDARFYDLTRSARVRIDLKFESIRHGSDTRLTLNTWSTDGRTNVLLQVPRSMGETVLGWKKWYRLVVFAPLRQAYAGLEPDLSALIEPEWIRGEPAGLADLVLPAHISRAMPTSLAQWAQTYSASTPDFQRELLRKADGRSWLIDATVTAIDPATGRIDFRFDDDVARSLTGRAGDALRQPDPQLPDMLTAGSTLSLAITFDGALDQPRYVVAGVR